MPIARLLGLPRPLHSSHVHRTQALPWPVSRRPDSLRRPPCELSDAHAIYVLPAGKRHGNANAAGTNVLTTDPDVTHAGIDVGCSPEAGMLRATNIAVGNIPPEP